MATITSNCRNLLKKSASLGPFQWLPCDPKNSIAIKPSLVIIARGKKSAKKQKKSKKDLQREEHKDLMSRMEAERAYEDAIIKVVRRGEPLDPEMLNPLRKRERVVLSKPREEERLLMAKEWNRFKSEECKLELVCLRKMTTCREKALRELKRASFPLYEQAVQLRPGLFPLEMTAPTHTPPMGDYRPPEPADV